MTPVLTGVVVDASVALAWGFPDEGTAYLDLAIRKALPLATLDQAFRKAAKQAGLTILGE